MPDAIVMHQPTGSVIIRFCGPSVVMGSQPRAPVVLASKPKTIVVTVGHQGPPGITGPIGPSGGQALQRIAGQTLSALVVVWEDEAGRAWLLDHTDEAHIFRLLGITLTAADEGMPINVQRAGVVDDDYWSWQAGQRIYLGAAGALTGDAANDGFDALIGTALSPTRLALNIQDPIEVGE